VKTLIIDPVLIGRNTVVYLTCEMFLERNVTYSLTVVPGKTRNLLARCGFSYKDT